MDHSANDSKQQHHHYDTTNQNTVEPGGFHHYVYDGKTDPLYDISLGHYEACNSLVKQGCVPDKSIFKGDWSNVTQGLSEDKAEIMTVFWQHQANMMASYNGDFKAFEIPLAGIRRLMKTERMVQMISGEVGPLMARAADLFVTELTMRAWMKAQASSRRTLNRSDIAAAASDSDFYDFLIDFLPREHRQDTTARPAAAAAAAAAAAYQDPTMQGPSMGQPVMHAQPPEYLPQGHPHLPQVGAEYQPNVGGIYAAPPQPVDQDRAELNDRKGSMYPHNLYDSIPGVGRAPMSQNDPLQ